VENETWCYIFALNNNKWLGEIDTMKTTIDSEQLTKLLRDPIIVRIVTILDIVSLSILELLEYDLTRRDINHALSSGVIAIDKSASPSSSTSTYSPDVHTDQINMLVSGDYYFYNFLNSKVKLTDVGLYILDSIKGEKQPNNNVLPKELEGQKQQPPGFSSYPDLPQ
jgi:hypothetical protein